MTSFLIHVGYPKTGTTFLQELYFPNHLGFNFLGYSSCYLGQEFVLSLANDYSFDVSQVLPYAVDNANQNVLSFEGFTSPYSWTKRNNVPIDRTPRRLKEIFGYARILIVIREQRSMIASLYFQYVKEGGSFSFPKFIEKCLNDDNFFKLEQLQYDRLIDCYQSVFGKQNVLILPYEMMVADMGVFLTALESFCGVGAFRPENKRVNSSNLTNAGVFALRTLNRIIPSDVRFTLFFRKVCHKLPSIVTAFTKENPVFLLDNDLLESSYASSNACVEQLTDLNLAKYRYCVSDS